MNMALTVRLNPDYYKLTIRSFSLCPLRLCGEILFSFDCQAI